MRQPWPVRRTGALLTGVVVAVAGALILGEYELTVRTALLAGVVFGLFMGEAVVSVGGERSSWTALACALLAGGGLLWAEWRFYGGPRSSGFPGPAWEAIGLAAATAGFRARKPRTSVPRTPPGS